MSNQPTDRARRRAPAERETYSGRPPSAPGAGAFPRRVLGWAVRRLWATVQLLWVVLGWALLPGCLSTPSAPPHEQALFLRHPWGERRMSSAPSSNATPCCVWRVRGASSTVYLAGTSHVLPDDQVPFPSAFYAAYAQAKEVYVECDEDAGFFTKTRLMFKALKWFRRHQAEIACPRGRTLADYVSPETTARLKAFYGKRYAEKEPMTPAFLLLSGKAELGGEEGNNPGVEEPMLQAARRDRKPIGLLDDASVDDTVIALLDDLLRQIQRDLARRGADAVIADEILGGSKDAEDLAAWRRGDLEAMCQDVRELRRDSPDLYDQVLRQRNLRWLKKLRAVLCGRRDAIVLVGAAHLWGEDGLLTLLRREGFSCEQLYGVDRPAPAALDAPPAPRKVSRHAVEKGAAWH